MCDDELSRGCYKKCLESEWLKVQTDNKWVMADNYFVYEMLPVKS